jgi:UDP-N-acetylglucosamine 3-dehydrogenase
VTSLHRYAIIGTGLPWKKEGATGFGMAHAHWPAFRSTERVELVAISDLLEERMDFFEKEHKIAPKRYTDYKTLLAEEKPDIVSICVWPHLHAEMTIAAAEAGVKAIHCEKPMALTWGDCKRMKAAADAHGVKLTFNHQYARLGNALARHDAVLQCRDTHRMGPRSD